MRPVLFDTSIYIAALRAGNENVLLLRRFEMGSFVWLSSVVMEELYAGAGSDGNSLVEQMEYDFRKAGRILVPNLSDWIQTGKLLCRLASSYGHETIGRGRLTNDALIATSASREGITIVTANAKDFARLAEFRTFDWRVAVT
jgi:predicted nucleic acid-binding protein